jgi:hypothetical protein
MRYPKSGLLGIAAISLLVQCRTVQPPSTATTQTGIISSEGFLTCFEPGLGAGKLWCEASAIVNQQGRIYLANDKDMPEQRSSVFYFPTVADITSMAPSDRRQPIYLEQPMLKAAHKFEEFAQSPDRKWTFLITAFDRIKPDSPEFDGYNMLLAWHPGEEGTVQVIGAEKEGGASLPLRRQIQAVLGGSPYFKIEGLAATNTHLWFGVREQGEQYDNFDYKITILTAPYRVVRVANGNEQVVLGDIAPIRNFSVEEVEPALPKPLAISSLEYDTIRKCFWLMTSYEQNGQIGAYLWTISEADMASDGALQLVRTVGNKPLVFTHKAEDMTFLDPNTLLVVHDDDRIKTTVGSQERRPNQAAYSVVKIGF